MSPSLEQVKQHRASSATSRLARPVQSPLALLLDLPRELRDLIYDRYGLDWNDIGNAMSAFEESMALLVESSTYVFEDYDAARWSLRRMTAHEEKLPPRSTPNLLLICRQITDEALQVLRRKPLALGPPVSLVTKNYWPLQITAFISGPTLQHVRHLVMTPDARGRAWCDTRDKIYARYEYLEDHLNQLEASFVQLEADDLHRYLWGIRNALKGWTALKTLTVRFEVDHPFEMRKMYYEQLFTQLVVHLPIIDVRLPEDEEVAEDLVCDLLTSGESNPSGRSVALQIM